MERHKGSSPLSTGMCQNVLWELRTLSCANYAPNKRLKLSFCRSFKTDVLPGLSLKFKGKKEIWSHIFSQKFFFLYFQKKWMSFTKHLQLNCCLSYWLHSSGSKWFLSILEEKALKGWKSRFWSNFSFCSNETFSELAGCISFASCAVCWLQINKFRFN